MIMGWFIALAGIFSICGAAYDWDFFMNNHKAQFFVKLMGRQVTRVFYGILGTLLAIGGILLATGVIASR